MTENFYSQSHADTQDRDLAGKILDSISANTRVSGRVARAGADDELRGLLRDELIEGDFVVAENVNGGAFEN